MPYIIIKKDGALCPGAAVGRGRGQGNDIQMIDEGENTDTIIKGRVIELKLTIAWEVTF
jgi:hypothetical protein